MEKTSGDEKDKTTTPTMKLVPRLRLAVIRVQHVPLSAIVLFSVPSQALLGLNLPVAALLASTGLAGMLFWRKTPPIISSAALLALLVWGKLAARILHMGSPDTALLLFEFTIVLLSMETSQAVVTFQSDLAPLGERKDELSTALRSRLDEWLSRQLIGQVRIAIVALGLSVILLPLAGFTSIPSDQLAISATLALAAMIVLLFLVTYKREPNWPS